MLPAPADACASPAPPGDSANSEVAARRRRDCLQEARVRRAADGDGSLSPKESPTPHISTPWRPASDRRRDMQAQSSPFRLMADYRLAQYRD